MSDAARIDAAPPPDWSALQSLDSNAGPAHRPELWAALAPLLEGEMRWAVVEVDGRLIGGAPAWIGRRGGFRWLHALPYQLSGAPLARPGAHAAVDGAVACAWEALSRELGVVGGEWLAARLEGPGVEPHALESVSGETRWLESSVLALDGGAEQALRKAERSARSEWRHARAAGLTVAESPDALEEAYALHLAQGHARGARRAIPLETARRLLAATPDRPGDAAPLARLFAVRAGGVLLGATFFLDDAREILAWWSGARAGARARAAMTFLYFSVVEWAVAAGRRRLNLGGSPGLPGVLAYKRSLGAGSVRYPVRWLDARHAVWPARLLGAIQTQVRRGRRRGDPA